MDFRVEPEADSPRTFHLFGELDLASSPVLVDAVLPAARQEGDVRLDLKELAFIDSRYPDIGRAVAEQGTLPDELANRLREAIHDFRAVFAPSEGGPLKEAQAAPLVGRRLRRRRGPRPGRAR